MWDGMFNCAYSWRAPSIQFGIGMLRSRSHHPFPSICVHSCSSTLQVSPSFLCVLLAIHPTPRPQQQQPLFSTPCSPSRSRWVIHSSFTFPLPSSSSSLLILFNSLFVVVFLYIYILGFSLMHIVWAIAKPSIKVSLSVSELILCCAVLCSSL